MSIKNIIGVGVIGHNIMSCDPTIKTEMLNKDKIKLFNYTKFNNNNYDINRTESYVFKKPLTKKQKKNRIRNKVAKQSRNKNRK